MKKRYYPYRKRSRKPGQCWTCSSPAEEGKTKCRRHLEKAVKRRSKKYHEYRAAGLCTNCGKPPVPGHCCCLRCKERQSGYYRKWASKRKGRKDRPKCMVHHCPEPQEKGFSRCLVHLGGFREVLAHRKPRMVHEVMPKRCACCLHPLLPREVATHQCPVKLRAEDYLRRAEEDAA